MEGQFIDGFAKDALLQQDDVGARSDDFLDQLQDVLSLFLQQSVDGLVVVHHNVRLQVGLWRRDWELQETDFGFLLARWSAGVVGGLLVDEDETFNKLALIDGATELLANLDVSEVDVGGSLLINDGEDSLHCHRGKLVRVVRDDLRRKRCLRVLDQLVLVIQRHLNRHAINDFKCLLQGDLEAVGDLGWVEASLEQVLASLEECAGDDDDRGGAVTGLDVLSL